MLAAAHTRFVWGKLVVDNLNESRCPQLDLAALEGAQDNWMIVVDECHAWSLLRSLSPCRGAISDMRFSGANYVNMWEIMTPQRRSTEGRTSE